MIILGPPGAGKGTQAELLEKKFGWIHMSTGDILREEMRKDNDLGRRVSSFVAAGDLVPDEVMIDIVRERIGGKNYEHGFILDGFPRTVIQAKMLDRLMDSMNIKIDSVISIEVDSKYIIDRLSKRYVCERCGTIYNNPEGIKMCTECGGRLIRRKDDEPDTISHRLKVYNDSIASLVDYYKERSILRSIDGEADIDEVHRRILIALGV